MAARPLSDAPSRTAGAPILVAVDDEAVPALEYAVAAARRCGCDVHLLHVVAPDAPASAHDEGERLLRGAAVHAAALASETATRVLVSTELAHAGPVAEVILQRAAGARQVVLQCREDQRGDRSEDGTCAQVACRASCPVVLVPGLGTRTVTGATARSHRGRYEVAPALPETLP